MLDNEIQDSKQKDVEKETKRNPFLFCRFAPLLKCRKRMEEYVGGSIVSKCRQNQTTKGLENKDKFVD